MSTTDDPRWAVYTDITDLPNGRVLSTAHVVPTGEAHHTFDVVIPLQFDGDSGGAGAPESLCSCGAQIEMVDGRDDLLLIVHNESH